MIVGVGPVPTALAAPTGFAASKPIVDVSPDTASGKHGAASETLSALVEAKRAHHRVEVVGQRGRSSTLYANPDGTLTQVLTPVPTRAKASDGSWVPVSTTLVKVNGRWSPAATSAKVSFRSTSALPALTAPATAAPSVAPSPSATAPASAAPSPSLSATTAASAAPSPSTSATAAASADPSPSPSSTSALEGALAGPVSVEPTVSPSPSATAAADGSTVDVADLDLPGSANIEMGFEAALPAPTVSGSTATYPLTATSSLTATTQDDGFSEDVVLDAAPATAPTYAFSLHLSGGLTPRLQDGVLEFLDAAGRVQAVSRPLQMWDAHRDDAGDPDHVRALAAQLTQTSSGWELDLTPDMGFLTDPGTQYPVTVDPTVVVTNPGDTYYSNGGTVNHTGDYNLYVGTQDGGTTVDRTYMNWNTGQFVGRDITAASLSLFQYDAGSCDPRSSWIYPTTTFSNVDSNKVSVTKDATWSGYSLTNTGKTGCSPNEPDGYVSIDMNRMLPGWVSGELPQYALEIRAGSETDNTFFKRFCSGNSAPTGTGHCEGTTEVPQLSVTYVYGLGVQPHEGAVLSHRLNDHSTLTVNTQDGNGALQATDLHVAGRGLDLTVDRFYNSLSTATGAFGLGWTLSIGPDVQLRRYGDNDHFDYAAPGGTRYGRFFRNSTGDTNAFHSPAFGGLDADLRDNGDGTFALTFHSSQETYTFSSLGCSTCNPVLITDTDRNGNAISYTYTGPASNPQLQTITDTHGRTIGVTYGSNGYLSTMTETSSSIGSPRTWTYHYNASNQLDEYTDATGVRTDYTYDAAGDLATITDPAQANGVRPKTTITNSSGQVTQIDYSTNATGGMDRWTYAYSTDTAAAKTACGTPNAWTAFATVTDPQGGATKYCYQDRAGNPSPTTPNGTDANAESLRVVDGMGHHRSSTYTPDMAAQNATGQSNDGVANGSTVYTYNTNNTLKSASDPTDNAGDTAGATSFDYATSSSVAGGSFLPSSTASTGSTCSSMTYDATGNLTDTYAGQTASGASLCSGQTGGKHSHVDYNIADGALNGTVKDAYGPVAAALATRTAADETTYTYFTTEPNAGELKKVVKPGGNAACTTDRTGCTTYGYDSRSRLTSTTDGNGNTTRYNYGNSDRINQVLTDGATTCTTSAGTCIKYDYDGEGNLTSRTDVNGTTTFTYDWLNNPATQTQPDGTVLTTTYDGAGNLTQYQQTLPGQSADTVNYAYDAANELTSVADAVGTFTYTYNNDARPFTETLPSSTGVSYTYKYTQHSGKFKGLTVTGGSNIPSYSNYFTDGTGNEVSQSQQLTVTLNGSNTYYNYAYDSDGHLKSDTPYPTTAAPTYSYTYDGDGNIRSATAGSTPTYFGYNENDQLCWSGPTDNSTNAMAQTCASAPSGDSTYTSDKAGENLGTSTGPISYNSQSQVSAISSPSGAGPVSQSYLDQGNNLRIAAGNTSYTTGSKLGVTAQTVSGSTTYYTRDPNGQILDEHGASGTYYYETDRLGSTMTLIDTSGHNAGGYTYDPYGKTAVVNGTSSTAAAANPWRYTGGYQDPTDGYYHLGARYYDAAGHFTQADSVGGSLTRPERYNSYAYAASDPLNNTDLGGSISSADIQLVVLAIQAFLAYGDVSTALSASQLNELAPILGGVAAEVICTAVGPELDVATFGLFCSAIGDLTEIVLTAVDG